MGVMSRETAGALIEAAFAAADEHGTVSFAFQGGEPTVAGLDFFRDFVAMVSAFRPLDRQVSYALQTNGMALNEEWTHFLKENQFLVGLSVLLGIGLSIFLFLVLPTFLTGGLLHFFPDFPMWGRNLIEGVLKVAIFLLYLIFCSKQKDIYRVFQYHGAEHKTINCIEHGAELTPENAAKYSRLHKRCGTSFLLIVMVVSIICFMFIRVDNMVLKIVLRVILVPVIAGVSFEIIQWAGRSESCLVNIVSKPGLMLQKLTTREPDLEMLEVAIASIEAIYDWRQFQAENRAAADGNSQKTDRSNAGVSQP